MSLINQMLQDLEKRHASRAERSALPNQVRVLPRAAKSAAPWWATAIVVAAALTAGLAWQFSHQRDRVAAGTAAQITLPAPPPAPPIAPPSGAASRLALELDQLPAVDSGKTAEASGFAAKTDKAEAAPAPPASNVTAVSVREVVAVQAITQTRPQAKLPVATVPAVAPVPAAAGNPIGTAAKAEPPQAKPAEAESVKLASAAPPAPAVATLAAVKPAAPAVKPLEPIIETKLQAALTNSQIDKRAQQLTPQQQGENEYRDAVNLLNQGRLADAQEGFRRALNHYPGHTGARQGLFGLLMDAQRSADAEQVLQEGLNLNPGQPGFAMALARLQVDRGNTAAAVETMQRAAPSASGSPDFLAFLAALLQRQSRHPEAVDNYRAALRMAPGSGVWLMGLAISLQAMNRNAEAQEAFRNAKATNTLNPELQAFVDQRMRQLQ